MRPPLVARLEHLERDHVRFELPHGLESTGADVLRSGVMRRATDDREREALEDFLVFARPETFVAVLLAKVVEFDGGHRASPLALARLDGEDLWVLERLYRELNGYPAE